MIKNRLLMLIGALLLISAQLVFPLNGLASSIIDGISKTAGDPYMSSNIIISEVDNIKHLPSVAFNSKHNEYLVVWHTEWMIGTRDIRAQRISPQAKLLGNEMLIYSSDTKDSAQPSVAYDPFNDRYLVTFIYDASGNGSDWDLYGRLIPWDGPSPSLIAFPIITWPTLSQWNPKVVYASTQQEFLVVWNNTDDTGVVPAYISGKRIFLDGSFPGPGSDLTLSEPGVNYTNPDLSYNLARNEYLVVWDRVGSDDDIWGVRLRGDAVPLGAGPFVIAGWPDNEMYPSVAACNLADKYLVVWQSDVGTGGTNYDIYGRIVTGDGVPDIVHWIDNTTSPEIEPSVACNYGGNQFLVAYQQRWTNVKYGITARHVFPDFSMKDAFVVIPSGNSADRTNPAVAGGGTDYLVAWEHQRDGTSYQDIYGRLITPFIVFMPQIKR